MWIMALSGIPCTHAILAIIDKDGDYEDYVYNCLKKETYLKTYESMMDTVNGLQFWRKTNRAPTQPPPFKVLLGKPPKNRKKGLDERTSSGTKMSKIGTKISCFNCH